MRGAGVVFAAVLLIAGCARSPVLAPDRLLNVPSAAELTETPFFPQAENHCGPAALATALSARGMPADPEPLAASVYLPARKGSLPLDMLGGARRAGAVTLRLEPRLETIMSYVAAGYPVIVLQNLGLRWYPLYMYVVGYDVAAKEVILRSGDQARTTPTTATFDATWARSGRWAMAAKPGDVPAPVDRVTYTDAVLALERVRRVREARSAYQAGLARWPGDLTLIMGAGNTAYALGDVDSAESAFRQAAGDHPDSDAALNNLAHVLAQRGALEEAATVARRAVALVGPNASVARATLDEITARMTKEPR
ncbi:MAG: PA2778 family cysteine peptidase [Burkholderiales bacterium]